MLKKLLSLVLLVFINQNIQAQCIENDEPKILLIGDSWAFFMNVDGTFNNVLDHWGLSNQKYITDATLAVNGATAEDFLIESRLNEIENQLMLNPSLKVVHISLGGNDFLGNWNVGFSPAETEALSDETYDELMTLIDFIKSVKPGIRIVFSGYMYANFEEVIHEVAPYETSHPFYNSWEDMGFPTFEQLNTVLNDFSDRIYDLSIIDPQIDFVNAPGLMQYHYGQDVALEVAPGGSYPALFQPLPYGDVTYPSPKNSMRNYGFTRDCFHLSQEGFNVMIDYQFQKLYHKLLMDDAYFLSDLGLGNGSVSSSGDATETLKMGETGGDDFATILSFNTSSLADTTVESASIFLRRESVLGINPIVESVTLRMKVGYLGPTIFKEAEDFDDEGDVMGAACVFGTSAIDSDWIRIDLPESFLPYLTSELLIQFSILAEDASGGVIEFTNGDDAEFAPVLNIKYKSTFVGITEFDNEAELFMIYPNPTLNVLNINSSGAQITGIEIINSQGEIILTHYNSSKEIDVNSLAPGHYFVRITSSKGLEVKTFIKQ